MAESRALSQWEIDALLNQIPESGEADDAAMASAAMAVSQTERAFARVIKTYDFRRPDKFSKEQWHTLQSMHETFARLIGAAFSSRMRTLVTVRLSSIDQGLYEEWQSQVPSQTVCYVLAMPPLDGNIVLEFNNDVASEVVDRLMGGNGVLIDRGREIGEIEMALLRSFSSSITQSLDEIWSAVTPVRSELKDLGLDAGLIQVAGPNDVVITAFFEVNLGNHLGAMSICVPFTVLEPIAGQLSAQMWHLAGSQPKYGAQSRKVMTALLAKAPLDIAVQLGVAEVPVRAVLDMEEGDTLLLDARVDRPLSLTIGGHERFLCRPGMVGNRVGVRVTDVVDPPHYDLDEADLKAAGIGVSAFAKLQQNAEQAAEPGEASTPSPVTDDPKEASDA